MTYMHRCHLCTDTYVHMYVYTHMFRWTHVYTPLLVLLSLSLSPFLSLVVCHQLRVVGTVWFGARVRLSRVADVRKYAKV